jgi:hypothetical protein
VDINNSDKVLPSQIRLLQKLGIILYYIITIPLEYYLEVLVILKIMKIYTE